MYVCVCLHVYVHLSVHGHTSHYGGTKLQRRAADDSVGRSRGISNFRSIPESNSKNDHFMSSFLLRGPRLRVNSIFFCP